MKYKYLFSLLSLILSFQNILSQEVTRVHEIDQELTGCIDSADQVDESDNGVLCIDAATIKMDRVLNQYYQLLMDSLTIDLQTQLKLTQRAWIKFKDEELKLLEGIEVHRVYKRSREWGQTLSWQKFSIIKKRAKELEDYYFYWLHECQN